MCVRSCEYPQHTACLNARHLMRRLYVALDAQMREVQLMQDRATHCTATGGAAAEAHQDSEAALRSELRFARAALKRETALPPRRIRRRSEELDRSDVGGSRVRPSFKLLALGVATAAMDARAWSCSSTSPVCGPVYSVNALLTVDTPRRCWCLNSDISSTVPRLSALTSRAGWRHVERSTHDR